MNDFEFEFECDQDWDAMEGDGAVRFCGECKRHVYNVSELDTPTAERVAADPTECVRVAPRADGSVLQANGKLWGLLLPAAIIAGCMNEPAESVEPITKPISVEAPVAKLEVFEPVKTVDPELRKPDRSTRVTFDEAMARAGAVQSERNVREGSFYDACTTTEDRGGRDPVRVVDAMWRLEEIQKERDVRTETENPVIKKTMREVMQEIDIVNSHRMGRRRLPKKRVPNQKADVIMIQKGE